MATGWAYVDQALAVLAALLRDAGKAEECRRRADGSWGMSDRGRLIGHRTTVIEWVVGAIARWCIRLPAGHEMGAGLIMSSGG
jgi:3'-5' exoribonuclease